MSKLKKVSIHQPEHLPWLGFLHKVFSVDEFVILNNVQYEKSYYQNRGKIRTLEGWHYITVPVKKFHSNQKICEIEISYDHTWQKNNLNRIHDNYRKSPFFNEYFEEFKSIYSEKYNFLSELNYHLIQFLLKKFKINTKIYLSSAMTENVGNGGTEVNLNLCKMLNADIYLSGRFGKNYLDLSKFEQEHILVEFQEFEYPVYKQQFEPFIPNMSSIDLLFNYGEESLKFLKGD